MLQTALTLALIVLFIHATTWQGMVNEWVHNAFYDAPTWVKKPLYDCVICMSVWWGFVIYVVGGINDAFPYLTGLELLYTLFAAGGINTVLIHLITYGERDY